MDNLNFEEVVFTGNFIRFNPSQPSRSNQNQNISWLQSLVTPYLIALGVAEKIKSVKWKGCGENDLYDFLGLEYCLPSYLSIFSGKHNTLLSDQLNRLFGGGLVVGFELPPFLIQFFDDSHIPYIDVMLGPLRFFPDLVPALRSNVPAIVSVLQSEALSEYEIQIVAGLRKAFFAKRKLDTFQDGTILLVGQVSNDTSQIVDGTFVSLQDYEANIQSLRKDAKVVFKAHPYASKSDRNAQMALMSRCRIDVVDRNIYELLCSEGIDKVVAVSSSVLVEAPYFEKCTEGFIDYPFPISTGESGGVGEIFNIYDRICTTEFWALIFGRAHLHQRFFKLPTGILAESLGQNWGASIFGDDALTNRNASILWRGLHSFRKLGKLRE